MTQISILKGIYSDAAANFRTAYPVNLEPVVGENGISKGYLRAAPGIVEIDTGPGSDRGAITWQGVCYRVMGTKLVKLNGGTIVELGDVGSGGPVSMDYSFDRLAIASGGRLYYWNGSSLTQVTDPDLGIVLDVVWIDGYFMTTDGSALVVTELSDPFAVNPLKYGSSEEDPDPVTGLLKVRGEVYALNANTTENFQNVGGNGFPFRRNVGGIIPKGAVGTHAKAYFLETFAFVGCGRNEALSVYLAGNGEAVSISTPEIDRELATLTVIEQGQIQVEAMVWQDEQRLLIHLPAKTLVYSHQATLAAETPVWHVLAGGIQADQAYPAQHFALCAGQWIGGAASGEVGYLSESVETQFGVTAGWLLSIAFFFNAARGGIVKVLELIGLPGRDPGGGTPTMMLAMTLDGATWGQEWPIPQGANGQRATRMQWRPRLKFANYAGFRFRGANTAIASFARLEGEIEPLNV